MKKIFRKRLKRLIGILLLVFVGLFIFRLIYGYSKTIREISTETRFFDSISDSKRNYASKKYDVKSEKMNQSHVKVDQKYEKIAVIKTKSTQFDKEEKQAREKVCKYKGLIQFEQKTGNNGHRKLNLLIGVPPESFDNLYNDLISIGKIQAKQITKKDKTNEYKELNAKKISLEKIEIL